MAISLKDPRLYVFIFGLILIAALAWVYPNQIASDVEERIDSAEQELAMQQAELERLQASSAEDMAVTEQEINQLSQQLDELDRFLPREYDQDQVMSVLTEKAENSGLTILALTPLPPSPMGEYLVYDWQMQLTGRFHRLGVFFDQLTQQQMITSVRDLSIQQVKASDGSFDNMECTFTVSAYVQM